MQQEWKRGELHAVVWSVHLKENGNLEDTGIAGNNSQIGFREMW